ncbi:Aminotransferase class V domain-containing protein OS=Streptomyces fumanus OX=67302 GN=GCM10018772_64890 PE=4 SV=1 [Streptomyces fumanus]
MDEGSRGPHSKAMETFETLVRAEFEPKSTYLNTASLGLLPARTVAAMREATESVAAGQPSDMFADVEAALPPSPGSPGCRRPGSRPARPSPSTAAWSPPRCPRAPKSSPPRATSPPWSTPSALSHARGDLKVRAVPLERIAESVGPDTALVAVSAVQSADGRLADLAALREAARTHGARTLVDVSQSAGWLPLTAGDFDFVAMVAYKWVFCPRPYNTAADVDRLLDAL